MKRICEIGKIDEDGRVKNKASQWLIWRQPLAFGEANPRQYTRQSTSIFDNRFFYNPVLKWTRGVLLPVLLYSRVTSASPSCPYTPCNTLKIGLSHTPTIGESLTYGIGENLTPFEAVKGGVGSVPVNTDGGSGAKGCWLVTDNAWQGEVVLPYHDFLCPKKAYSLFCIVFRDL